MLIDWFTVIAQIINFLILVALLKFFLFGRIRSAMLERKQKIASQLDEAREKHDLADRELEANREERHALDEQKEAMLRKAALEAQQKHQEYLQQAKADAQKERDRLGKILDQKKAEITERFMIMSLQDSARIAERIIRDLTAKSLEEGLVEVFIERLKDIDPDRRQNIMTSSQRKDNILTVNSSFVLPDTLRLKLSAALQKEFYEKASIKFQHTLDLILGIEVAADGYKVSWTAERFLEDIEEQVTKAVINTFGQQRGRENE